MKVGSSHLKGGSSHLKGGSSYLKGGSSHLKGGSSHLKGGSSHLKGGPSHLHDGQATQVKDRPHERDIIIHLDGATITTTTTTAEAVHADYSEGPAKTPEHTSPRQR